VTHARVYRSDGDAPGTWYEVSQSSLDGADLYGVPVASGAEGDPLALQLTGSGRSVSAMAGFVGPPAGVTRVVEHIQRLFVCGSPAFPNRLWWTGAGELRFGATQFISVGRSSDKIVSAVSLPLETPVLLILCRNSVWTLSGYDESTFLGGLRQIAEGPGCSAPHGVVKVDKRAWFWNHSGIWECDGNVVTAVHGGVETLFKAAIAAE
jgi:hypothetical protein